MIFTGRTIAVVFIQKRSGCFRLFFVLGFGYKKMRKGGKSSIDVNPLMWYYKSMDIGGRKPA